MNAKKLDKPWNFIIINFANLFEIIVFCCPAWFHPLTVHQREPFKRKLKIYGGGNEMVEVILSTGIYFEFRVRDIVMMTWI